MYRFDESSGELRFVEAVDGLKDPAFIRICERRKMLYTFSQADQEQGEVYAKAISYRIDASSGKLSLVNERNTAAPTGTHINTDHASQMLMLVSYGTGILSLHPLAENGEIGPLSQHIRFTGSSIHPERQGCSHPHSIYTDPSDRFAIVPDLGTDKVVVYRLERKLARLDWNDEIAAEPGAGPRHLAFHPVLPYAYLLEELSSRITVFHFDPSKGKMRAVQAVGTLPDGFAGVNLCAEIQTSPDGRFVYASNRGHDSIAVFATDAVSGTLSFVEHVSSLGKHPRNFCLTPDGRHVFVANKDSNSLHVLTVNKETGKLSDAGISIEVAQPSCVRFFPTPII